jgi:hypothetical protein
MVITNESSYRSGSVPGLDASIADFFGLTLIKLKGKVLKKSLQSAAAGIY